MRELLPVDDDMSQNRPRRCKLELTWKSKSRWDQNSLNDDNIIVCYHLRTPWKHPQNFLFGRWGDHHGLLICSYKLKGAGLRTLLPHQYCSSDAVTTFLHWLRRKSRSFGAAPPPPPSVPQKLNCTSSSCCSRSRSSSSSSSSSLWFIPCTIAS